MKYLVVAGVVAVVKDVSVCVSVFSNACKRDLVVIMVTVV
jgi:hypothetical protein